MLEVFKKFVSKPQNIIFDHLPKCGGTSLNKLLESNYSRKRIFKMSGSDPDKSVTEFLSLHSSKRNQMNLIYGHLAGKLIHSVDKNFIVITVLREPIDRIISHYYYVQRKEDHYLHSIVKKENMSLEDYAVSDLSEELRNWYVQHFSGLSSVEVKKNKEKSLKMAICNLENNYDLVGFLNEYDHFLSKLIKMANFKSKQILEKNNKTLDRPTIDTIPIKTLDIIKNVNDLDIQLYDQLKIKYSNLES